MRIILTWLLLTLLPLHALATTKTSFSYAGIYNSLKTAKATAYSQLQLNFVLLESGSNNRCPSSNILLSDGNAQHRVLTSDTGALLLPVDKNLKQDHAAITFDTASGISCYLSMEISVADFELAHLSQRNLLSWLDQFDALYRKLAGWPGRYFMPSVVGLTFVVNSAQDSIALLSETGDSQYIAISENRFYLSRTQIETMSKHSSLQVSESLIKVLPKLED